MDVPAATGGGSEEKTALFSDGARPARQDAAIGRHKKRQPVR
jgi:hypothetical protein